MGWIGWNGTNIMEWDKYDKMEWTGGGMGWIG